MVNISASYSRVISLSVSETGCASANPTTIDAIAKIRVRFINLVNLFTALTVVYTPEKNLQVERKIARAHSHGIDK